MPLRCLASDAFLHGTRTRDDANALWANIQAFSVQKLQFCVQRGLGIFPKHLKDVARRKQKFYFRIMASKFRDSFPVETAFEVAALFCHFAPGFQRVLSLAQWAQVLQRFFRGQFECRVHREGGSQGPKPQSPSVQSPADVRRQG